MTKKLLVGMIYMAITAYGEASDRAIVQIMGQINAPHCRLHSPPTITLPPLSSSMLTRPGAHATAGKLSLDLSGCDPTLSSPLIAIRLQGTPHPDNPQLLAVSTSTGNAATGVGVRIKRASGSLETLIPNQPIVHTLPPGVSNTTLDYAVDYESTPGRVEPGVANVYATFHLTYP